ncbi:MAG: glycosyltransferase family 39 protein [Acidimicrobiales bacterium]
MSPSASRWAPLALPATVGGFALLVGAWQPGPLVAVADEQLWLARSQAFSEALADGRLTDMTSAGSADGATMPGVTTMWVGTLARAAGSAAHALGLLEDPLPTLVGSAAGLRIAHLLMAGFTALLIGLTVVLVRRLLGTPSAAIVGVLLAVEPFLVSNGTVLHTDSLVALPALAAFLALALACRPEEHPAHRTRWAALSGLLMALALLTKVSAAALLPGLVPLVAWAAWTLRHHGAARLARRGLPLAGAWTLTLAATVAVAWPAAWLAPRTQLRGITDSVDLGVEGHINFFRGAVTFDPGPAFYPVALAIRLSPWLLAAGAVGLALGLVERRTRALTACAVLAPLPYLLSITLIDKKFDRYALPAVPFLVLIAGLGLGAAYHRWAERPAERRPLATQVGAVALSVALAAPVLVASPHAHAWVNPLVGQERATEVLLRGRGEGMELAGREVAAREAGRCDEVRIAVGYVLPPVFPCGELVFPYLDPIGSVDYVVVYLNQRQRGLKARFIEWAETEGRLVFTAGFGGVDHVWLYEVPRSDG